MVVRASVSGGSEQHRRRRRSSTGTSIIRLNSSIFLAVAFLVLLHAENAQSQADRSLMGLISPREIAELTQLATDLAAQTMQSNTEVLSKPGRPEVRPISLDQSPSQILGQSFTNLLQPAREQLTNALMNPNQQQQLASSASAANGPNRRLPTSSGGGIPNGRGFKATPLAAAAAPIAHGRQMSLQQKNLNYLLNQLQPSGSGNRDGPFFSDSSASSSLPSYKRQQLPSATLPVSSGSGLGSSANQQQAATMNSMIELANMFLRGNSGGERSYSSSSDDYGGSGGGGGGGMMGRLLSTMTRGGGGGGGSRSGRFDSGSGGGGRMNGILPNIRQFLPNADQNFGIEQGEGCLPFIGEFMRIAYGNCVRQADERTWDTWGKEITNALMGGKIDLLKASRETCKKGAEREQCGQIRKAVSDCDILGSIQLVSNMQRSVSRCDEISGIIDQNPVTVLNQMNGLINGEMAQGFLNNFLG